MQNDEDKRELAEVIATMLDGLSVTQALDVLLQVKSLVGDHSLVQTKRQSQMKRPKSFE